MPLLVDHRIVNVGMRIVSFGQKHRSAQINWLSPKISERLALDLDVLHILRVGGHLHRRNGLRQGQADVVSAERIKVDALYIAIQISGRTVELLSLPLVVMRPDDMSVSTAEFGVDVE